MENLQAIYSAIEQADEMGDFESVKALTDYVRSLPAEKPITEKPVDVTQPQPDLTKPPVVKPAIQAPIDVMGQQFTPEEYAKYSGMPIAAKPGEQAKGEFSGAFGRSIYNLAADLALAHGRSIGNTEEAEATAKRLREYGANTYTNTTKGWKEDPLAKIQELAGGSAPYMLAPITAALGSTALGATGLAAVAAPMVASTLQFTGSNLQRQMDQNKKLSDTSLLKAGALAIPQAVLDQIGFRFIPGIKRLFGAAGKEITDEVASKLVKRSIISRAGEKALATGEGMAIEGGTEAAQQLLERLQAGLSITNAEARKEYFESFVGGSILSGGIGVSGQVIEGIASKLPEQKQKEVEKEIIEEPPTEEQRASRDTLVKETLKDLEDKANQVNQAKADAEAQLKAAQQQQVVTEATDLESMAPVNPMELTDTTLTSWGLSKNSKPYKTLIGQDAGTPEGRALIDTALESYMGKINEPAVDTYKSLLDQQKVEADNGPRIDAGQGVDTGTIGIDNEVLGQPKYGTPGTVAGYNEPTVNISGTPTTLPETREADVNAPLETAAPVVEEAPVEEVAPVSTQPKLASQLRALDSTNPLIEALQFDQASEEEVAVAQDTIQELQTSRKAKKADLTKVSEEEKDIPLEARGEIQNTGETPDTIEGAFQKQYGKNVRLAKQRGLLNFLSDVSELPKEVGPVTPGTKAVYHKGKGYFITNRITKEDAPRMLLHEIGVHYGLEGMLGTNNYKRIVKQIKQNHLTDKELKASWDNTLKTYPELTENSDNFMQEVIANIGETAPNNSIFRQIVGYIKQFLSKLGYGWDVNKITADDIRDMVQQSVRMSLAGKIKGAQPDITMKGEEEGALKPTYYSALSRVITNAQFKNNVSTQSGEQWANWLNSKTSEAGVKRDELEFSGILEFLELNPAEKFNKQDILTYLNEYGTKVDEYMYGEGEGNSYSDKDKEEWVEQGAQSWLDSQNEDLYMAANEEAADNYEFPYYVAEADTPDADGNKQYIVRAEGYQGLVNDDVYASENEAQEMADEYNSQGVNEYADVIYNRLSNELTIQEEVVREELADQWDEDHENVRTKYLDWTLEGGDHKYTEVVIALQNPKKGTMFSHQHWPDISNPIAHYRVNARADTEGNLVLFVEEIQSDWAQAPRKLRKQHIIELATKFKANNNSPLSVEEISKQIAKFVPGDWGFKREFTPEQKKEYDDIVTRLSNKQKKRALLSNQIYKYRDFEEKLRAYIDHEVRKIISPNINTSRRTTVVSELSDDDFKVNSEYNSTRNYYLQTILNKDLTPYNTTIYGYKIDNNIVKQILNQPGVKTNVDQYTKNNRELDKLGYEVESIDEDIKDLESKKSTFSQLGKVIRAQFVQDTEAWSNLVLKNIIRFAAERGYDKVAFVNGKQAAFKGGKAEAIDEVFGTKNQDGTFTIYATLKDGGGKTRTLENIRDLDLEDYVGGLADKFRGLKVGETDGYDAGELKLPSKGMVEFYDGMILRYAAKLIKKLGGTPLETIELIPPSQARPDDEKVGMQRGFAITSAMRDKAMAGQPLFARMSEQELDRQLAAAGNKRAQKVQPPSFKDNLMAHPLQTVGDMVRNFRKAAFSFDFAINQKIMAAMRKAGVSVEEIARSFYQMQISQAVKSDQIADLFMIHGNIKYDPNSFKFVVSDVKDSMTSIRDKLTSLAKKYNFPEYKMYEAASRAFIARRSQGLIESNKALKQRVLKLMIAGKTAQARTQMERNYKLVHLTAAEIKEGEKFFTDFKDSNGKSELEKLFKSWNKNRARVLNFAKDQGLYSQEDIDDLLDVMDYVPFYRDAQIEAGKATKEYPRGLLDAAVDKRLKGSYQPVNNVFDNMERWTRYTIRKSVNNRAAQEKIRLYSQWVPDDIKILRGKERPKSGNIVNVWQNGKLVKYEFEGTDGASMVDGFTGLEPVMIPFLNGTLRPVSNFLRLNIVLQPVFSIAQIPMDIYNSMFTSQVRFPLAVPLQAIKEIMLTPFGMSAARNYLKTTGTVGKHDFSSEYDRIDIDAMNELKKAGSLTKLVKLITHPLGVLAMASDNVIRQAVYSQVMLETKDQARAVHMAEEIINFRRTGSSGVVNIMRQNAPFVNANLQSIHIALSTLVDSGIGPDTHGKAFKRLVTTGSQMFILAMIYAVLNADDDDYKKADPLEKDRYLFIPGSNGFKLPLRNDIITLLFKTLPEHLVNRFLMESEDSTKLLHALTVGFGRALALPSGIPTLISPLIEANYNIDSNTGRPIIGRGQENLEEDLQYSNKYTTQLSRMMGEASGTSPAMIQHFFNRYFGTTSLLLGMVTNGLVAAMRGEILPEKTVRDYLLQIPSMGSFVAKEHGSRNINDYYELNEIVTKIVKSAQRYEKQDYPKYQEYISKDNRAEIINMQKEMAAISKELQVLRDYENRIYASKDANRWTPATKKAELDRLEGIRQNMLGSQLKLKERSDRYIQQLRYRGGL